VRGFPQQQRKNSQTVCKPGSVRARRRWMTIHLGRSLPNASRNLPGQRREDAPAANRGCPYSVLLPVGFTMPPQLPLERCALTAPFHPYLHKCRRFVFCGTFPRVTPAGRYPAPYPRGARTFLPQHLSVCCARSSNRLAEFDYSIAATAASERRVSLSRPASKLSVTK